MKALVDVPPNPYVNHAKSSGVIGVDLNVDHFAVSNVNAIGQLIDSFSIKFDIHHKTSGQLTKIIEAEAISLVDYAVKQKKPIVLEKMDTTKSKVKHPYGSKKANRLMSQFAYQKMITAIKSRADKMGVEVFEVNPAYTTQIGKIKYMRKLGISIHEAASFVIARRGMDFKEKLPPVLHSLVPEKKQGLHHWVHWAHISNSLSDIRKNTFYRIELSNVSRLCSWNALFPQEALTDFEKIGLSKLESRKSKA
ncbi:IS200/IS605 family accessory protein TnpB-related protein [Bacillus sp. IITD106]|nr:IS200/IS605 family accessory protein TnpB-related protein [Bacillus sp. IITD106]